MRLTALSAKQTAPETQNLIEPFADCLARRGLRLVRVKTTTMQVNVGFYCNLLCRHCHLEAGPQRRQAMTIETMEQVIACASRVGFETVDITGGAPELTPHITHLLQGLAKVAGKIIVRTNLLALREAPTDFISLCRDIGVTLVASFPSIDAAQADAQRGAGFWQESLAVLRELNQIGYGCADSGLTLNLAVNPIGAFLPEHQGQTEKKFRQELGYQNIFFNHLYCFANVPLGRFRSWLEASGNLADYLRTLHEQFNAASVEGLMCRSLIAVSWEGYLYDCDFNIAAALFHGAAKRHISSLEGLPAEGINIAQGEHCYACTAGAGFT